ncbi:MAG: outer membrane lipoprotein-sorting protein, partial [Oligoflexales bacterium]|nr:outer membrane lipoprotein-sorting protein [Oligoflexales bacterium]
MIYGDFNEMKMGVFVFLAMLAASASASEADVKKLIDKVDRLMRADTSHAFMEMRIETEEWSRDLEMEIYTEGLKKTFIVINSPKKDKGIATLRIDNEMWNFFPKINKTMKIPPSMMMSSWMGSDFTNDDLVKESTLLDDYSYKLVPPEDKAQDKEF